MAKTGRPKIEIDWSLVQRLCNIHCTGEEIASILGISYDTLQRRVQEEYSCGFADYYKKAAASGKMSLRRKQFESALDGNTTMLVWLGKNILGQKDAPENGSDRQDININIVNPNA